MKDATTYETINLQYAASTVKPVNDAAQKQLAPLMVQSFGQDKDRDGLYEQWNITVGLRLPANTVVQELNLLTAFDYRTSLDVMMQMEGLAHVQVTNHQQMPLKSVKTQGTLIFN